MGAAVVWERWYGGVIFCLALRMVCIEDEQWAVWGGGRAGRGPSVDQWFYCII